MPGSNLKLTLTICDRTEIPEDLKQGIVTLKQQLTEDLSNLPSHAGEHYLRGLNLPVSDIEGQQYVIGQINNEVIGFAMADYRTAEYNDRSYATMQLVINRGEEKLKEYMRDLFSSLVQNLPPLVKTLRIDVPQGKPEGEFYSKEVGAKVAFNMRLNVSDISQFNIEETIQEAKEEAQKLDEKGYELLYRTTDNFDTVAEDFAPLMERVWNFVEESNEETVKDVEAFPVERVTGRLEYLNAHGAFMHVFLAKHKETGKLVGFTEIAICDTNPIVGNQILTGVIPEHRRQGIGYSLKMQSLVYMLTKTKVRYWETGNATMNAPMLKINEKLGYKLWVTHDCFEIKQNEWEAFLKA